jgi:hypothetical protein
MGYYIETAFNLAKDLQLIDNFGAVVTTPDLPEDKTKVLVCVVQNGPFDAAGVVFNEFELRAFTDPDDDRRRTWLLMDRDIVVELCPAAAPVLA